jgi:hypothetical protein
VVRTLAMFGAIIASCDTCLGQQDQKRVDHIGLIAHAHEIEIDGIVQKPEREPRGPRVDRAHEHDDNDLGLWLRDLRVRQMRVNTRSE